MKELSTVEVRVLNNVSQAINTSVKLGDILQTMIQEQIVPESTVVSETPVAESSENVTSEQ